VLCTRQRPQGQRPVKPSGTALDEAAQPLGGVLDRKHRRQQFPQVCSGGLLGLGAPRPGVG